LALSHATSVSASRFKQVQTKPKAGAGKFFICLDDARKVLADIEDQMWHRPMRSDAGPYQWPSLNDTVAGLLGSLVFVR
jgi:hypothetical protein